MYGELIITGWSSSGGKQKRIEVSIVKVWLISEYLTKPASSPSPCWGGPEYEQAGSFHDCGEVGGEVALYSVEMCRHGYGRDRGIKISLKIK